tara:strand:+ start:280 stop:1002 length:723 start_codon:yes stop_codon:yes gene_type:complete
MRRKGRSDGELREIKFTRRFTKYAEGSVLVEFGDTRVLCNASIENKVPNFLKGKGRGWLTAEYSMLPRATDSRGIREVNKGRATGRTMEIQRLIGRSLRAVLDLKCIPETTIYIDCDVLQADGGTRTAAITGSFVAVYDAVQFMLDKKLINQSPIRNFVGAVSVGILGDSCLVDLDYIEDSSCDTDMNIVMTDEQDFIELQGTAEGAPFDQERLNQMLDLGKTGILQIIEKQKKLLEINK